MKTMNKVMQTVGVFLLVMGLIAMAGAGGDCDGKCMDQANTLSETLMAAFIGVTMFITGSLILIKGDK